MGNKFFFEFLNFFCFSNIYFIGFIRSIPHCIDKGLGGNTDSINVVLYSCFIVFIF